MFTPITRFFVCIFWNAVRNHRISMFTPITRFLVCICRLCASTPVNGHKLSVAVYDTGPLTLNSVHYYYQDYAFQSYRPRTMKAIQNNKGYTNNNKNVWTRSQQQNVPKIIPKNPPPPCLLTTHAWLQPVSAYKPYLVTTHVCLQALSGYNPCSVTSRVQLQPVAADPSLHRLPTSYPNPILNLSYSLFSPILFLS